jgi:hypothetical protein
MIWIFSGAWSAFLCSYTVYNKMKSIFRTISHEKTLWSLEDVEEIKRTGRAVVSLFGETIQSVLQQFSLCSSDSQFALILLIFWDVINGGGVGMEFYVIAGVFSYSLCSCCGKVIPQYTLFSLGQLVDQKRLNETVAHFHLEEARYQRLEQIGGGIRHGVMEEDISNRASLPR